MLTDAAIRAASSRSVPYKLTDSKGLYLLVHPSGAKYWRMKYRYAGKQKTLAIGVYPEVKLIEAREARDEARRLLKSYVDPAESRKQEKRLARLRTENAFELVAREWHEQQKSRWTEKHAKKVLNSLKVDIFPRLGHRPIAEITPPEVLEVIRAVERRQALDVANRLLQRCRGVFRYAIQTGWAAQNPASELVGVIKTRQVTHLPAMPRKELPEFLRKLEAYDGHPITRLAFRLLVLTFVRSGELRGARWSEFDPNAKLWRVPAERMKMKVEHIVPLSRQALDILEALRPFSERFERLFPNQNRVTAPISENTLTYALYRLGYKSRATVHGFRATASTILNESGWTPDAIERQLAHLERNKVRAAYHRSEYLEERIRMMQWWADYLDQQLAIGRGENVVIMKTTPEKRL